MTIEDMQIRDEILGSVNGEVTEVRQAIDSRLEHAMRLAVWDQIEPQFIRASE